MTRNSAVLWGFFLPLAVAMLLVPLSWWARRTRDRRTSRGEHPGLLSQTLSSLSFLAVTLGLLVLITVATNVIPNLDKPSVVPSLAPSSPSPSSSWSPSPSVSATPSTTPSLSPYPEHPDLVVVDFTPEDFNNATGNWSVGDYNVPLLGADGTQSILSTHALAATLSGCDTPPLRLRYMQLDEPRDVGRDKPVRYQYINLSLGMSDAPQNVGLDVVGTIYTYDSNPIPFSVTYGHPFRYQIDVRTTANVDIAMTINPTNPLCSERSVQLVDFESQGVGLPVD